MSKGPYILQGDVLDMLRTLPDNHINTVVTSPPYWGLRDYDIQPSVWGGNPRCDHVWDMEQVQREMHLGLNLAKSAANTRGGAKKCAELPDQTFEHGFCGYCGAWRGCFGLEPTPALYISHAVEIFREVRRVLRDDGTLWLNIGDSYAGSRKGGHNGFNSSTLHGSSRGHDEARAAMRKMKTVSRRRDDAEIPRNDVAIEGLKPKDLVGMPWRLAFALQADGWWLRQDIIWHKPNPMPESVQDRCTKAHEYVFLLSKSERYHYDADVIKEPVTGGSHPRKSVAGWAIGDGDHSAIGHARNLPHDSAAARKFRANPNAKSVPTEKHNAMRPKQLGTFSEAVSDLVDMRNKRSVWTVPTEPFPEAHFATFPQELVRPCILAGCPPGGYVLDPFCGSGTTLLVAEELSCHSVGIEINPEYIEIARRRLGQSAFYFAEDPTPTVLNGEEVIMPAGAVMGSEFIDPAMERLREQASNTNSATIAP